MTDDTDRLQHYIELLQTELHQAQRRQQELVSALDRARHELVALQGGIAFFDGEALVSE